MRLSWLVLVIAALCLPAVAEANEGITGEIDVGYGRRISGFDGGGGAVGLAIGYFVTPDLAVMLRTVDAFETTDDGDGNVGRTPVQWFTGPVVQVWLDEHFYAGGGIGVSSPKHISVPFEPERLGLEARVGYRLAADGETAPHAFGISVELIANTSGANDPLATGVLVMVDYQHL